jgi:ferredoxin
MQDRGETKIMADKNQKHPLSAAGFYFTDDSCTDCDLCREIAPSVFKRDAQTGSSYVWQQPATGTDVALAHEALQACPSDTIGIDGEYSLQVT